MSSATARTTSSGSESDVLAVMDQRKRKRMESNRDSARRSRMRKQRHLDDLIGQVAKFQGDNARIAAQISTFAQQFTRLDTENAVLQAQVAELTERLHSLNSVLRLVEDFSGVAMDIPEVPDPLLKPWQLPCPSQAITASAMFQY
ncbi:hypothetical protein Taro_024280 [Colocasia esculenta]|uniref:BZIP domain-containing protein n=1 Tax=Colocasia esculenta TaxID=4460 RepID=A0A843V6Z8_COLES|nr:hypothetical protein [Colocasia esculenta]